MLTDKEIKLLARRLRRRADRVHGRGWTGRAEGLRDAAREIEQWIGVPAERNRT